MAAWLAWKPNGWVGGLLTCVDSTARAGGRAGGRVRQLHKTRPPLPAGTTDDAAVHGVVKLPV